jgi:SAM-dependent methyltransferase
VPLHNPSTLKFARRILPEFLRKRLDPFHWVIEEKLREFAAALPAGARVLDAGAGECPFRHLFSGNEYVAVDSTVGDPAWDYSHLSVIADLTALPFADGSFSAVICVVVLEHVSDPAAAFREFRRVLGAQGRCFVAVPQIWELHQAPNDFFRYTRHGLEHLMRSSGLRTVSLEPTGGYFQLLGKLSVDFLQFFESGAGFILFIPLAPLFGFLIPLVCYYLDKLDRRKDFALGFVAVAEVVA